MDNLSRDQTIELLEILEEKEKRKYIGSYFEFFKAAWHVLEPTKKLIAPPFIKYLCDRLQHHVEYLIENGHPEVDVLIINLPPGQSKSSICTKFLNAWVWAIAPHFRIMNSSYNSRLSYNHCVKSRDIISSSWYQNLYGKVFKLKSDQNQKSEFGNDKAGVRMATSLSGGGTGFHFDLWIDDDPLNPKQAASKVKIESAIDYIDETVPSRIPDGLHVIVMQRLHMSDPTGHILKKRGIDSTVEHICLPAELSNRVHPPELSELYQNGYLDEKRLGLNQINKFKNKLGSYGYAGQYDQYPTPKGGGKVKEDWFEYCHEREVPKIVWDLWVDGAYTKSTANDPSGLVIAGFNKRYKKVYIKHARADFLEMPEMLKLISEYAELHELRGRSRVRFEPKASGKSFRQMVNASVKRLSAVEISSHLVQEGKEARLQTASPKLEAGKVVLVKGNWNDAFVSEICNFPNADHDEFVDLIGYICDYYFDSGDEMEIEVEN
jgi:predicted phage terminase large subunit-like protein